MENISNNNSFKKQSLQILSAVTIYALLALYLYYPYLKTFKPIQFIIPANSIIAALGCLILSQKWLNSPISSIVAGTIYGFSPYALSFALYHPIAGTPLAIVPWLFIPAAFYSAKHAKTVKPILALLPFAAIILFFTIFTEPGPYRLFPIPKFIILGPKNADFALSLYHLPLIAFLVGLFLFIKSPSPAVLIIVSAATFLSCYKPILEVTPITYLSIVTLFASILAGLGIQAAAKTKNIILTAAITAVIAIDITLSAALTIDRIL